MGAERIWIPASDELKERKNRFAEVSVNQGSKQMKGLNEEAVSELMDYAGSKAVDAAFLRGTPRATTAAALAATGVSLATPSTHATARAQTSSAAAASNAA